MFTGLIQAIGTIKKNNLGVIVDGCNPFSPLKLGDSVSVDGVCLTVSELMNDSFFSNITERESFDSLTNNEVDIVMTVDLDKFEYLTPQLASNDKFSIWFKYKIKLYDTELALIQNWDITGYGEQATGSFDGDQSMANAINIALRDVGANLTIQLEKEKNELLDLVK